MKNDSPLLPVFVLLLLFSFSAQAQTFDFALPIHAGYARISNPNEFSDDNVHYIFPHTFGLGTSFTWLPKNMKQKVQFGIQYNGYRQRYEILADTIGNYEKFQRLDYLVFPIGFQFDLPIWGSPQFGVGLKPGILFNASRDVTANSGTSDTINQVRFDNYDDFEEFNLGFYFNLMRDEELGERIAIRHGLHLYTGILDVISDKGGKGMAYKKDRAYAPTKTWSLHYSIGAVFRIN